MNAPKWAQNLLLDALVWWEGQGNRVNVPTLTWWRSRESYRNSSGRARVDRIHITAGRDRTDQKLVLLHEVAHILNGAGFCHDARFWDIAWQLYRWAKLPIRYCQQREYSYKVGAKAAYKRSRPC